MTESAEQPSVNLKQQIIDDLKEVTLHWNNINDQILHLPIDYDNAEWNNIISTLKDTERLMSDLQQTILRRRWSDKLLPFDHDNVFKQILMKSKFYEGQTSLKVMHNNVMYFVDNFMGYHLNIQPYEGDLWEFQGIPQVYEVVYHPKHATSANKTCPKEYIPFALFLWNGYIELQKLKK